MNDPVKGLRAARTAETEEKILRAATDLFVRQGYAATTLTAVAAQAGVAPRTVYVRFGTKAALLKRAADVAMAGDTAPIDIRGRDWFVRARTAPTAEARIAALVTGGRHMLERSGDILAVALEAAATEPDLAAAAQAAREATHENIRLFWTDMARDSLIGPDADLDWLIDTTTVLVHAETYLLARKMIGWDPAAYEEWLTITLTRMCANEKGPAFRRGLL
ncbi:TetR/AcrR family transcriptional regulator [Spirillospora albida]|uniref:TetR/AcrR family transcriptional regulator n=1 Tax=Spirillospora albida TaxID=58123 RepID=UPI00068EEEFD|nr:TetR/AcrR family transcriptional regulator [Spirillospora albida]